MWTMGSGAGNGEAQRHQEMGWRRRQRPENEVPASLAIDAVLADNGEVVVFISGARVFSNGVGFTVEVRARQASTDQFGDMFGAVHGHGGHGDRLLLGFEFSDGGRCTNIDDLFRFEGSHPTEGPFLTPGSGNGGARSSDITLFLSPLPPPGDLRVVCAWPTRGLPETITVLSADSILEAAQRARVLWPWEPEPEPERRTGPPAIPEGGWFASQQADIPDP